MHDQKHWRLTISSQLPITIISHWVSPDEKHRYTVSVTYFLTSESQSIILDLSNRILLDNTVRKPKGEWFCSSDMGSSELILIREWLSNFDVWDGYKLWIRSKEAMGHEVECLQLANGTLYYDVMQASWDSSASQHYVNSCRTVTTNTLIWHDYSWN